MISIGSCDYCGEDCSEVGVRAVEEFELPNGWIPTSRIERHIRIVERRYECGVDGEHVGPWHDSRGWALETCRHCFSRAWDFGDWNSNLDHRFCRECGGPTTYMAPARRMGDRPKRAPSHWPGRPWAPDSRFTSEELGSEPTLAALSVAPADRERAERALRDYFGPVAMSIAWHDSPRGLAQALTEHLDSVEVDDDFEDDGPRAPSRSPGSPWSLWSLAGDWGLAPDAAGPGRLRPACEAIRRLLPGRARGIGDAGQFDWRTVAAVLRTEQTGGHVQRDAGHLRLMHELRLSAGPTIMLPGQVLLSERPLRLRLDDRSRPHSEDGPAIAYPDGFTVWAVDGVAVPRWLVAHPERLTADAIIAQRNAEVRRVMLERFGVGRFVSEGHGQLIAEDDRGRLWRMDPPPAGKRHRNALVMVEVLNATAEPDGSFRTYFLRVPPSMTSATEAVAWTFGLQGGEYEPLLET